jgi:hypothetical protein
METIDENLFLNSVTSSRGSSGTTAEVVHTRREATDSACRRPLFLGCAPMSSAADPPLAAAASRTRHKRLPSPPALLKHAMPPAALHHVTCKAALVLGRAPMYSAAGPPLARPQQLSTTSRAPRGQLLLLAVPSSCSSLPSAVLCPPRTVLTTPRPSHPQPSARNRPGERMSLLDEGTYGRPDAEVLPLITPATTRATDRVRRISHATRGRAPPGGEAVDRAGAGEGSQGEAAARPYDSAHSPSLARPVQAPCPSHPLTHLIPHPLFTSPRRATCSSGIRPFTTPLRTAHRWRWYRRSSRRTRRPPRRRTRYAAPTLPRASEAISGHHR